MTTIASPGTRGRRHPASGHCVGCSTVREMKNWAPALCEKTPDVTMETCSAFLKKMYHENNDFLFSVTHDFVRGCTTPVLVMPDDTEPHP